MFDAGTIEAQLTVNTSAFGRDLDLAKAKVKAFEDERHEVKISAVFDTASMSKAKQLFGQLDQSISREAMQRLRSSPQGSVLGALNALFSPHPVTGAPTASQAGQQGLLGQMVSGQGGGVGNTAGGNRTANGPAHTVRQVLTGTGPSNTSTTDTINQRLVGNGASDVTTTDTIRQKLIGNSPGNTTTTDTVRIKVDKSSAARAAADAKASGDSSGRGWASAFSVHVSNAFKTLFGSSDTGSKTLKALDIAGGGSGSLKGSLGSNLVGAAAPGISGISGKVAGIIGLGGSALGAVPALLGVGGTVLGAGLGAGVLAAGFKGVQSQITPISQAYQQAKAAQAAAVTPQQVKAAAQQMAGVQQQIKALDPALQQVFKSEQQIQNTWQKITAGMAPLFAKAMSGVSSLLTSLAPSLKGLFGAAGTFVGPLIAGLGDLAKSILPPLDAVLRATAPLLRPLLDGLGKLAGPLLSGLATLLKAALPAVTAFGSALGTLGKDLGSLLADGAPVIKSSALILKDLLDVVSSLFPIIGKLAQIFAAGLAPVFDQFSKIVESMLPFLVQVGKILASLAGAAMADLVSLFGALATVLRGIAPSFTVLAKALGSVFQVLENSSVFEILANAIESMAGPLAQLVSALVKGLAPILPPVISFVGQLAAILATQLSNALVQLLPPLTQLATAVLQALAQILPVILPALTVFITLLSQYAVVDVVSGLAKALGVLVSALPPGVLIGIAGGITAVVLALKGMAAVSSLSGGLGFLTTLKLIGPVVTATIASLAQLAVSYVSTAAAAVAGAVAQTGAWIATAAAATAAFIAENAAMLGIGVAIAALIAGIVYLATHWQQVWTDIKNWTSDAWHWLDTNVFQPMINWFTQSLPHAFDVVVSAVNSGFVQPVENAFKASWSFIEGIFTGALTAIEHALSAAWSAVTGAVKTAWDAISSWLHQWWYVVLLGVFTGGLGLIAALLIKYWGTIESNVKTYWGNIVSFFKGVPSAILSYISSTGGKLASWGSSIMTDMLNGIKGIWNDIINFFKNLPGDILHALGIKSPPQWAIEAGQWIMKGLGIGMGRAQQSAADAATALKNKIVGGTAGIPATGSAQQAQIAAMKMAALVGWTGAQWTALNNLAMAESGWSMTAKNPQSGAYGIAQFINGPSEYATYGGNANTLSGQLVAFFNYIQQRYGSPSAAWAHEQADHWYGKGGPIDEPVIGWGTRSGDRYVLGEKGREWVVPDARMGHGGDGSSAVVDRLDKLIDVTAQVPAGVGRHVGSTLNNAAEAASFRNRYPQGGW